MCTSIIEIVRAEGMAKRGDEWFHLSQTVVAYDHARHAPLGDVITLDFINADLDPGARAGIELTLETAKELRAALDRAIAAAERGGGSAEQGRRAQRGLRAKSVV
jgi:phosphoserine aminotransferase